MSVNHLYGFEQYILHNEDNLYCVYDQPLPSPPFVPRFESDLRHQEIKYLTLILTPLFIGRFGQLCLRTPTPSRPNGFSNPSSQSSAKR
jgi:hypothetical protein